jgi:hypothetical protein
MLWLNLCRVLQSARPPSFGFSLASVPPGPRRESASPIGLFYIIHHIQVKLSSTQKSDMSNTEGESVNLDVVINYPRIESQLKAERYEATQYETDEIEFDDEEAEDVESHESLVENDVGGEHETGEDEPQYIVMPPTVDAVLVDDTRDFFQEATAILKHTKRSAPYVSALQDLTNEDQEKGSKHARHLIVLDFIALSLVRDGTRDVASVCMYTSKTGINIYWSKNCIGTEDGIHAAEFARYVRSSAKATVSLESFQEGYFSLLWRQCANKVGMRKGEIKKWTNKKQLGKGGAAPDPSIYEEFEQALEKYSLSEVASPIASSTDSTDTEIRNFLGSQATNNMYINALKLLGLLFDDIRLEERQVNGQVIQRICHYSDLLANSTAVAKVTTTISQENGISSLQKLGL